MAEVRAHVDQIRRAAAARVETTALREVAREVGITPMGLRYFINGGEPRTKTRQKLETWYLSQVRAADLNAEEAVDVALEVLLSGVPEGQRQTAVERCRNFYADLYRELRLPAPGWLSADAHQLGQSEEEDGG